jgi:hypothetical protein
MENERVQEEKRSKSPASLEIGRLRKIVLGSACEPRIVRKNGIRNRNSAG